MEPTEKKLKQLENLDKFIEYYQSLGKTHFNIENYKDWCNENNIESIPDDRFNAIILVNKGYAGRRENGLFNYYFH